MSRKDTRIDHRGVHHRHIYERWSFSMSKMYLGVDIAKDTHYAAMTDQHGVVLIQPFPFTNDMNGFRSFWEKVESYMSKNDVTVGFESTAHYATNFIHFLDENLIPFMIINPLVTSSLRVSKIRKTKTDSVDALLICQALQQTIDHPTNYRTEEMENLYALCCARRNIIQMRTKAKIQFVSNMDRNFPELAKFLKGNLHIKTCYELIKKYPTSEAIKKVRIDALTNLFVSSSHGRYGKDKALELKELAKVSIGINSSSFALQAQLAIGQIELYTEQLKTIDKQIDEIVASLDTRLKSIPGMDSYAIAVFLSATNNLSNFTSPCKVLAYAGLDPVVSQSGKFKAQSTKMSKRGNSLLRYSLVWTAWNVCLHNSTFMNYYNKKRMEGKSHYSALGHCAGKLNRIIFKMIKDNVDFNLD